MSLITSDSCWYLWRHKTWQNTLMINNMPYPVNEHWTKIGESSSIDEIVKLRKIIIEHPVEFDQLIFNE